MIERLIDHPRLLQDDHVPRIGNFLKGGVGPHFDDALRLAQRRHQILFPHNDGAGNFLKGVLGAGFVVQLKIIEESHEGVEWGVVDHLGVEVDDAVGGGVHEDGGGEGGGDEGGDVFAELLDLFGGEFGGVADVIDDGEGEELWESLAGEGFDGGGYEDAGAGVVANFLEAAEEVEGDHAAEAVADDDGVAVDAEVLVYEGDVVGGAVDGAVFDGVFAGFAVSAEVDEDVAGAVADVGDLEVPGFGGEGEAVDVDDGDVGVFGAVSVVVDAVDGVVFLEEVVATDGVALGAL